MLCNVSLRVELTLFWCPSCATRRDSQEGEDHVMECKVCCWWIVLKTRMMLQALLLSCHSLFV